MTLRLLKKEERESVIEINPTLLKFLNNLILSHRNIKPSAFFNK